MDSAPANQGYPLPPISPNVSAGAALIRRAAIEATTGSHELAIQPRGVVDQQALPCCVSCALSSAMETMDPAWPALSPLFHYYVTRYDNGGADSEGLVYLDDGLGTLTNEGISRRDLHSPPFTDAGGATKPSAEAFADALTRALGRRGIRLRYTELGGPSKVAAMREELAQDHPVVIGFRLPIRYPQSFLNSRFGWLDSESRPQSFLNSRFEWLNPESSPLSSAGHCVLVVGYNDARTCFHIQDSRGSSAFDNGLWWMGYRVVDSSVVQEAYSLTP